MSELNVDVSIASDDTFFVVFNGGDFEMEISRESFQAFVSAMDSMAMKGPGRCSSFAFGLYDEDEYSDDPDEEGD